MRALLVLLLLAAPAFADEPRFAQIGDFKLESGEIIRNCRIGYRVAGDLNEARSNAILLTTWFSGRSGDMSGWVGAGKLFDTTKYHVIIIDALGNGVSSSPSNSVEQPGENFPRFTIRDMVRSQHEVVTRELKIEKVHAVAGLSMGGMQTFQWLLSYPEFAQRAIPIVGTTKLTSFDILLWQTQLDLIDSLRDSPVNLRKAMNGVAGIQALGLRSPTWIIRNVKSPQEHLATHRKSLESRDPFDYMSQLRAMIGHDVYRDFEGSAERAAKAVRARMLVIVAVQDAMVLPQPAREFARLAGAEILTLTGDCGHLASGCEREVVLREVHRFLAAD